MIALDYSKKDSMVNVVVNKVLNLEGSDIYTVCPKKHQLWNARCSVKIRVIFGVRFERRKVNKKSKYTWKLIDANSILEYFEDISAKFHQNRSL